MARSTGIHLVLPAVLCLAAGSLAADTGMLYVKSFPAGATVVIAGKERGKTPVLVRDLPAGEVTVELRIAGVKPVTKVAAVEANKVATIDVAIEVPRATLTVVSEPLEATVILDGRDAGKTPTTLEDLQPGEHSLVLLKDGHPKTTRSVVLKPGDERLLEVRLGTAGVDETERPAAGESAARAAKSVPVEVQLILTMLKDTVAKGNHSETRRNLALALKQPDMAEFKQELLAAIRVVQALEVRQRHIRKGAEALVGKEATLRTKSGARSGKVEGVSFEGITMASSIIIDGQAAGETRGTVKWSALAPAEQDRLAEAWKPEGLDGAVARTILAQARKDKTGAGRALAAAGEHPLGKYLGEGGAAVAGTGEEGPDEAWARIEKKYRATRMTATEEVALDREIRTFKDRYGKAGMGPSLRRRMRLAGERAKRRSGLVAHWTFDEGRGSVAGDSSGRGKHGRIRGARRVKGKIGGALDFDGKDDYVQFTAVSQTAVTICAWINAGGSPSSRWPRILNMPGFGLAMCRATNQLASGSVRTGVSGRWTAPATLADTGWHHVAVTYDGSSTANDPVFYLDGSSLPLTETDTPTGSLVRNTGTGFIGDWAKHGRTFDGLIDDVRIYYRALSAEEVKALATAGE